MNTVAKIAAVVLFLLALVLGALGIKLARTVPEPPASVPLSQPAATAPDEIPVVPVVVAARALPPAHVLAAEDLRIEHWPSAPGGGHSSSDELLGQVTRLALQANEPILASSLARGLATELQAGERAVAIAVDEVMGVANRIQPGDWVDVFFTLARNGADAPRNQARLLLPRVRVLAYGAASVGGTAEGQDTGLRLGNSTARTAVLAVPLASVNELLLATGNGRLQLAMRAVQDDSLPAVALFPEPPRVLVARPDLDPAQREVLSEPVNQAYAGIDLPALSGPAPTQKPAAAAASRPAASGSGGARGSATIEIVRGTKAVQEAIR